MSHSPSIRPYHGDRRATSVRDVGSTEPAQGTATSDAAHGQKELSVDGSVWCEPDRLETHDLRKRVEVTVVRKHGRSSVLCGGSREIIDERAERSESDQPAALDFSPRESRDGRVVTTRTCQRRGGASPRPVVIGRARHGAFPRAAPPSPTAPSRGARSMRPVWPVPLCGPD